MRRLLLVSAATVLALAAGARGADSELKVKEGDPIPDIALAATQIEKALPNAKDAKTLSLKALKGKNIVLFFYPKANTPG